MPTTDPSAASLEARHRSPWSARQKAGRALWYIVEATLFRYSPRVCYGFRRGLLRCFGASIGPRVFIRSSVKIEVPWHLTIAADARIGDEVILYCLGNVTIGARAMVSQYSHLCAGTHDYTLASLPLIRSPIVIGADAWVAADVFVGPGVTIGEGAVVGARSSVHRDLPPWMVCVGNPARPVKPRPPFVALGRTQPGEQPDE